MAIQLHEAIVEPSELERDVPQLELSWAVDARTGGDRVVDYRPRSGSGADETVHHITPSMGREGSLRQLPTAQVQCLVPCQVV